jgi:hypothetical protein
MQPKFELGKIVIKEDAAFVLALAGQDADFFLAKHAAGDWGEEAPERNEHGLREGRMVWSSFRTLRGHQLMVQTFLERQETHVFCPPGETGTLAVVLAFPPCQPDQHGQSNGVKRETEEGNRDTRS